MVTVKNRLVFQFIDASNEPVGEDLYRSELVFHNVDIHEFIRFSSNFPRPVVSASPIIVNMRSRVRGKPRAK